MGFLFKNQEKTLESTLISTLTKINVTVERMQKATYPTHP